MDAGEGSGESLRGRRGSCPQCDTRLSVANMARHLRSCRYVGSGGGELRS